MFWLLLMSMFLASMVGFLCCPVIICLCVELVWVRSLVDLYRVEFKPPPDGPADLIVDGLLWFNWSAGSPPLLFDVALFFSLSWFIFINLCSVDTQKYEITVRSTISVKLSLDMLYCLHLWSDSSGMSSNWLGGIMEAPIADGGWLASLLSCLTPRVFLICPLPLEEGREPGAWGMFYPCIGGISSCSILSMESNSQISFHPLCAIWMSWPRISMTLPMLKRSIQFTRLCLRWGLSAGSLLGLDMPSWFLCVCLYILKSLLISSISSMD